MRLQRVLHTVWLLGLLAGSAAAAQPETGSEPAEPSAGADGEPSEPGEPSSEPGEPGALPGGAARLKVQKLQFRGNRKVEDDAIRVNLRTHVGGTVTQEMLREDVRTIWKMGYFEDAQVEATDVPGGVVIAFVLKEKPSIAKIYVSGNEEISLSKINEVLDIKRDQILDLAKVKRNVEKIRALYSEKGYYMADVGYEVKRKSPTEVDVWLRVHENAKVEVRRVNFVGNKAVPDSELREAMMTREGNILSLLNQAGTYREDVFQRDMMLLQAFYWDRGYVQVKLGQPLLELSPDKQSMYITISIDEGPQYRLGSVDITGDLLQPKEYFLSRISVKTGDVFNRSKLSEDLQKITDYYKDRGYAYANVSPSTPIDDQKRIVHLVFEVQKGEEVYFNRINVRGNTKTRDKVIRRELRIFEGDLFNQAQLDLSKKRVNALGFFEKVDVSTKRGEHDDEMDVNIEVTERPTGTFQIGAGFSSYENFIAQAQISQNNLFGRGTTATLQAQISSLRRLFLLQYQDFYFLDTNWTFGFNAWNQQRYLQSFTRYSTGGSLTWGYLLAEDLRLMLTYTLEDVSARTTRVSNLFVGGQHDPEPENTLVGLLRSGWTSSVRAMLSYDSRDNRMFPTRGWYNTISQELAQPWTLSENVFSRTEAVMRFFYPVWGPFVFRMKLEGGLITSSDPRGVPIFERYFVGGIYDLRGVAFRSLGAQIRAQRDASPDALPTNFRIGGNLQLISNFELEFPIFKDIGIRGVVFVDAGNAFNLEKQYHGARPANVDISADPANHFYDPNAWRASWGFGFRWFSPIGPLRFEWGIPFRTLPGEQPMVFEFTIGNFF